METVDNHESEQMYELQRMLVLNIKAEIQAADNFGDIADWLDTKLSLTCASLKKDEHDNISSLEVYPL